MMLQYIYLLFVFVPISFTQKSYDGAQLFRFENFENSIILNNLTENFGGVIWKNTRNGLDISFEKENLSNLKDFVSNSNLKYDVLIPNVQELIELSSPKRQKRSTSMNWTSYHTYSTIVNFLFSLQTKYSNIAKIFKIGRTYQKRKLLVLRITNNVTSNDAIWIDGGFHAREWVSPASVTFIANYLLSNWNSLPTNLQNKTWYIMPVVNPDGYVYSHTTDRLWRKNRKKFRNSNCVGVDLNRNFNVDWNSKTQTSNFCSETYKGWSAFSEAESRAIRSFLTYHISNLKGYLTYHSYGQYILWPYGFTYDGIAQNAWAMQNAAEIAASNIKAKTGMSYTTARDTILGLISGASDDWAKKVLKIPYTYTIELRDTGKYGFILPANQITSTANEALEVAIAVANAI